MYEILFTNSFVFCATTDTFAWGASVVVVVGAGVVVVVVVVVVLRSVVVEVKKLKLSVVCDKISANAPKIETVIDDEDCSPDVSTFILLCIWWLCTGKTSYDENCNGISCKKICLFFFLVLHNFDSCN